MLSYIQCGLQSEWKKFMSNNFMGSHKQVCQKHFQLSKVSTTRRTFWLYFAFVSYESNQTMLWPAVHHRKDTTHKTLSTICIHKMCNNNIKFIEMLGVNGSNVWPVSSQQHATTYNSMSKWTQHVTSNNVVSICTGLNPLSAKINFLLTISTHCQQISYKN